LRMRSATCVFVNGLVCANVSADGWHTESMAKQPNMARIFLWIFPFLEQSSKRYRPKIYTKKRFKAKQLKNNNKKPITEVNASLDFNSGVPKPATRPSIRRLALRT